MSYVSAWFKFKSVQIYHYHKKDYAKVTNNKKIHQIFPFAIISAIGIFGLISTTMIITTNLSSFQVKAMAFATKYMQKDNKDITIISGAIYSWIPKYIFHKDNVFFNYKENDQTIKTSKALLMVDRFFKEYITDDRGNVKLIENIAANAADNNLESYWYNKASGSWIQADLGQNNIICGVKIAWYNKGPQMSYDYVISVSSDGSNFRDVYSGISHTRTYYTSEKYDFVDTIGRYVRITVNGNAYNNVAAISEINVYGHSASMGLNSTSSSCKSLEIGHIMAGINSGYIPADTIFKGYKPTNKGQKSYPYRLGTLYNNTKLLADFEGISQYYDLNKYPYTNIGNSIGGSFVEIRPNYWSEMSVDSSLKKKGIASYKDFLISFLKRSFGRDNHNVILVIGNRCHHNLYYGYGIWNSLEYDVED